MTNFKDLYSWYKDISYRYNYTFSDNGWFGLYGLTYQNNVPVASKFYVNIETPVDADNLPYIENKKLYLNLVQHADPSRCFNNCIALKKHNNKLHTYFHIKFKDNYRFAEQDFIDHIDLSKYRQGVSVDETIKRYYYVTEKEDIQYILTKLKINQSSDTVKYLEVTINPLKCILIFPDNYTLWVNKVIENNCSKQILNDVRQKQDSLGIIPCLFGKYYNDDIRTVYWDLTTKNFYPDSDLYKYIIS